MNSKEVYPGRQWQERFEMWADWFAQHKWRRLERLSLRCAVTKKRLSYAEALALLAEEGTPVQEDTRWGKHWEYGWFQTSWSVPQSMEGERLIFAAGVGEEMLVWINGREAGAIDKHHDYVTLTRSAKAGEEYTIVLECYAGHGPRMEGSCICAPDEEAFSDEDGAQQVICPSYIGCWQESVFQVGMDYLTLYSLLKRLPCRSLRAMKVTEALQRFITKTDLEADTANLVKGLLEADKELQPLLSCVNGSTAPQYSVFGQSHLDLAWLWTLEETRRKSARTYGNQLALMEEYPEYRFLLCEPPVLEFLKESYPDVWRRVREKTVQGQIYADGAVFVEGDMNMPCGESLVRQFLYGKQWFRQELGVESTVAWMPDTFGFSPALPQIMKQCNVKYFTTQKLVRQDPECEPFPYNIFWWQGLDGSRILSQLYKENNAVPSPEKLIERWENDRVQTEGIDSLLYPFGYGDGGGGATREELELVRRCADLEGAPRLSYESPRAYFERLEQTGTDNVFTGELYLAWHRGTYTGQARTKRGVRRAECLLKEAEYWDSVCALYLGTATQAEALRALWKRLLLQEFHDILPGTGIASVHKEAEGELADIAAKAGAMLDKSLCRLEEKGAYAGAGDKPEAVSIERTKEGYRLSSRYLCAQLDRTGQVTSLILSENGREYTSEAEPMNRFRLYRNVNTYYDAWEIGRMYEQEEVELVRSGWTLQESSLEGREALLLSGSINHSPMKQYITLSHDGRALEFHTQIDWQERHKLLKVDFAGLVRSPQLTGEVAFGAYAVPTERSWQWEKDRYELCRHRYSVLENGREGFALINDSKYGVSARESCISLTLLRAPLMPDKSADRGPQEFSYACRPYAQDFRQAGIVQAAIAFNRCAHLDKALRDRADALAGAYPLYEITDAEGSNSCHVCCEAIKQAEDGSGRIVLRLYEAGGVPQTVWLRIPHGAAAAVETNLLEEEPQPLEAKEQGFLLEFGAFAIRTIVIERQEKQHE